jgi:hypothetical protein
LFGEHVELSSRHVTTCYRLRSSQPVAAKACPRKAEDRGDVGFSSSARSASSSPLSTRASDSACFRRSTPSSCATISGFRALPDCGFPLFEVGGGLLPLRGHRRDRLSRRQLVPKLVETLLGARQLVSTAASSWSAASTSGRIASNEASASAASAAAGILSVAPAAIAATKERRGGRQAVRAFAGTVALAWGISFASIS